MKNLLLFPILALTACATIYPHAPASSQPAPDSSTPPGYDTFNSGYLGSFTGKDGKEWEALTLDWRKANPSCPGVLTRDQNGNAIFGVRLEDFSKWFAHAENNP